MPFRNYTQRHIIIIRKKWSSVKYSNYQPFLKGEKLSLFVTVWAPYVKRWWKYIKDMACCVLVSKRKL